jgi:hypothetical protein
VNPAASTALPWGLAILSQVLANACAWERRFATGIASHDAVTIRAELRDLQGKTTIRADDHGVDA